MGKIKKQSNTPICSGATPEEILSDLKPFVDFQEKGLSLDALNILVQERLLPHLMQYDHPGFQSMFNCFPEEGAKFGAKIALRYNQGVTNWQVSPGGVMLEEMCCRALCQLFGLSLNSDATFMLSGTYANQQALYMALHWKAEVNGFDFGKKGLQGFTEPNNLVLLASSEAHYSVRHAVRILGLGDQCIVPLAVDKNRRIDVGLLEKTLDDLNGVKDVFCVFVTTGTTSTGSVDPVLQIINLCKELGAWLHVDGAYGLAYSLVPEWKSLFSGIELADSVCWDPHKQLGVPIPNSVLFVRRREDFDRMALYSDYFSRRSDTMPNPGLKSPPSTRPFAALSLVTSLRHQGMAKVVQRLRAPLVAIKMLAENLKNDPEIELCHEPETGILCFRVVPENVPQEQLDQLQQNIYDEIMAEGSRSISLTRLDGRTVLRLVVISPSVTSEALMETISKIKARASTYRNLR